MSYSIKAKFYQASPGGALQASSVDTIDGATDNAAESAEVIGVKATATLPSNVSEFAAHFYSGSNDMDYQNYSQFDRSVPGNTLQSTRVILEFGKKITLDADWAPGHYAFVGTVGTAGAILKCSTPFRIR